MTENTLGTNINKEISIEMAISMENSTWIDSGIYIAMSGVIIILIGYVVEKKKSL